MTDWLRPTAFLLVVGVLVGSCQPKPTVPQALVEAAKPEPQPGRYVIVNAPSSQSSLILLDTATGRTWREVHFTDMKDNAIGWTLMGWGERPDDWHEFVGMHPFAEPAKPEK